MKAKATKMSTQTLTLGAVLTAMVVILQFLALGIKAVMPFLPFTVSLVLIPIVIGAAKCGPYMGAWLGFVFGVIVLLSGDAAAFLTIDPFGTVLTVLVKGTLCGLASGLVYRLLSEKNKTAGVYVAAAVCPIVNTGLFFVGCLLFFMDTVSAWAASFGYENVALYMFVGLAGFNFVFELIVNLVLSPMILRALNLKTNGRTT
ncbi:MAG: ECF transporter S component [Ruminococcaceae bacterium]|nr:ECF transporter S component [Oscillospiraceae bacterium]